MERLTFFFANGSWWVYALLCLLGVGVAWITYRHTNPSLASGRRLILRTLRAIGISLLLIALFEPVMRFIRSDEHQADVVIAVDESTSMLHRADSVQRVRSVRGVADRLLERLDGRGRVVGFATSTREHSDVDSLTFTGERTDISSALTWAANQPPRKRPSAVVVISDGNVNSGDHSTSSVERSAMGIYAVAIGDTVQPVDAAVLSVITSGMAVVNEPTSVAIDIGATGLAGDRAVLELLEEDRVIDRDTVTLPPSGVRQRVDLAWTPGVVGTRKLTARLTVSAKEATTSNNVARDLVDVRSAKRTVLLFAGAPSPDVRFIRTILESDPNITLKVYIQKQEGTFYIDPPSQGSIQEAEAVILVGFPVNSTPRPVIDRIARACESGTSLLFVASRATDYSLLAPFKNVLPFGVAANRPNEFQITPDVRSGAMSDPLMKVQGVQTDADRWIELPPIYRTETFVTPAPGAVTLATIRVNNVPLAEPLILKREAAGSRAVAVLGYGLYRWELLGTGPATSRGEPTVNVLQHFLGNTMAWLSVRDDERRIRIRTDRMFYGAGEVVTFKANILDESFIPVNDADVRVTISSKGGSRDVVLTALGSGRYTATVNGLSAASYVYRGEARRGDRLLGTDGSRFEVGALGLEDAATFTNISYLRTLAMRTGGIAVHHDDLDSLIDVLLSDVRLQPTALTTEKDLALWNTPWMLIVAILSFSLEWFLRKRSGLV
jgi:hypothetical protein